MTRKALADMWEQLVLILSGFFGYIWYDILWKILLLMTPKSSIHPL